MTTKHLSDTRFSDLNLHKSLMQGIEDSGFLQCTPIQEATLPLALEGKDIAGQAQTGTGKTAAFLIATIQRLLTKAPNPNRKKNQPLAFILAPTRELAIQIHKDAEKLVAHTDYKLGLAFGGTDYEKQRQQISDGVDILIGTPGRLIDYLKQHVYNLKMVEVVVLDEADRMFDLGFIKDLRFLLRRMPPPEERLGLLFSATLSHRVSELAYEHMNSPEPVKIESETVTTDRVKQVLYHTANEEKIPFLVGLLNHCTPGRSIIFANTKRAVERISEYLEGNGFSCGMLSGDVPQRKRMGLLDKFKNGDIAILIATDVAARGLHIPDVTHVFNFDLPQDAEDYVHRIGRTGRLDAIGDAISFACEQYSFSIPEIEEYVGHKIPVDHIEPEMLAELKPPKRRPRKPKGKPGTGRPSSSQQRSRHRRKPAKQS